MTISIKVPVNDSRLLLLAADFLRSAASEPTFKELPVLAPDVPTMSLSNTYDSPAPAPNNVEAEERDANGVIWKAEFHAATKTKTVKEIWKLRKGMTDTEKVAAQEYIALFSGREVTPPEGVNALAALNRARDAAAQATQPATTFPELMAKVNELNMAGTMTAEQITELVKSMGFDGLGQIINQPEIISQLMATLQNV